MEPQHFNWLDACNAVVLRKHEMDKAEFESAKHPSKVDLRQAWIAAWQAHHAALQVEFMTRLALV
jgi:hypothetical protein